ncbi:MraY family glycosyltransferase [Ferviditalea candida]|uniref:MraY family glycosyltransferase n=1 Tax=Ferviditalea candida TaxID=3108399 RepID=A0ABU5ZMQ8_9BACL|nr:MraY family glycosyltransferase [Paenibacillaceae bacterium T2]
MQFFLSALLTSFVLVLALVPAVRRLSLQWEFVDRPSQRKIHTAPVPLMGGVAIFIGSAAALMLFEGPSPRTLTIVIGGLALVLIGSVDDWYKTKGLEFPVWPRLIGYILVSSVPLWFGIEIAGISDPIHQGYLFFTPWLSWLMTMGWIFAITNMINFIDGVDGLAAGIASISALTLMLAALYKGQEGTAVLAAILAGACIAFLGYNFYPAKIFMGDAGATFLGYTLAVIAVDGAFKSTTALSILIPILALGVPILDTSVVFIRRLLEKKSICKADKLHTHHSLLKMGLSQVQTVSFLYLIAALFSAISIILLMML